MAETMKPAAREMGGPQAPTVEMKKELATTQLAKLWVAVAPARLGSARTTPVVSEMPELLAVARASHCCLKGGGSRRCRAWGEDVPDHPTEERLVERSAAGWPAKDILP